MKKIAILGAGGHTRSSFNLLSHYFSDAIFSIYDESYNRVGVEHICDVELVGRPEDIAAGMSVFLSIGDNQKRAEFFHTFESCLIKTNLIHPCAFVERRTKLGIANQVFANAYMNTCVELGDNNIINTASILEHEVSMGSHNHIAVGAKICGRVSMGSGCFVGAGAVIIDKIQLCDNVTIGAGAVVTKSIVEPGVYVGIPAKRVK